ncbi:sugar transporter [Puteibacter caeruleilacunae]|nr:sugar transporter [Puteibacter caeruleilacunae]
MQFKFAQLFIVLALLITPRLMNAQDINPASVNVTELSDEQIRKIMTEMETRGLTMEQAAALAKARGASQMQVDQMMARIQQLRMGAGQSAQSNTAIVKQDGELDREVFSTRVEMKTSEENKKVFGYNLFNSENLTFEPSVNIAIPQHYILGKGDQVVVNVWGASQQNYQLEVDANGSLQVPDLGPIYVSGLTLEKARKMIKQRLVSIYSGMSGDQPNTWAEVSIGSMRGIKVNVLGEVNAPGTYTLPATATAFNALYLSGGANENGSLRNIKVLRDGQEIQSIDVYDFLINGNASSNIQLRDQDILLVPAFKTRVTMAGAFKRNAYFELREGETLADAIRYAGNFSDNAYSHRLSVERKTSRELQMLDVTEDQFGGLTLMNGDSISAGEVLKRYQNRVSIGGAVFRPGYYQLKQGMKLSDLLELADGVKEDAYLERAQITRLNKDNSLANISFNVKELMNGTYNIELQREDSIQIASIFDLREEQIVQIHGEVIEGGKFPFMEGMSLKDIIFKAKGLKESADVNSIEITRRLSHDEAATASEQLLHTFKFKLKRDLAIDEEAAKFKLEPFDHIYVRVAPGYAPQRNVSIEGEAIYKGTYGLQSNLERVSHLLKRAGGFTDMAYLKGAYIKREVEGSEAIELAKENMLANDSTMMLADSLEYEIIGLNMKKILSNPLSHEDLWLHAGDVLVIPRKADYVKISGGVLNPVSMPFEPGRSMKYYIQRAGGFGAEAFKKKSYVIYANGTSAATKSGLWRKYPKIEPGAEIVIPNKIYRDRTASAAKWISMSTGVASVAASILGIISLSK